MTLFAQDKIILDLCGGTGAWSKPYADAGYDVRVITFPPDDVRLYMKPIFKVYGILAAPPCTMFSLAGNKSRAEEKRNGSFDKKMIDALSIVDACLRIALISKPVFWVLENPVGTLKNYIGSPVMFFNPCDYGGYMEPNEKTNELTPAQDAFTKKTGLWGVFNKPTQKSVEPEFVVCKSRGKKYSPIHYNSVGLSPTKRAEVRSVTPTGFAKAFFEANP